MLTKHARDKFSRTDITWENSMPLAKQRSYARTRAEISLAYRANRSAFPGQPVYHDGAPRPSPRVSPSLRSRLAAAAAKVRSICAGLAPLAEHAGSALPHLVVVIVSWVAAEALAGFATYARAMYPSSAAMDDHTDHVRPRPVEPGLLKAPRPNLRVISADNADATGWE